MDLNRFSVDTAFLSGTLDERLAAVQGAGFSRITLWAKELMAPSAGGLNVAEESVRNSGLQVSALQVLRDYEGLSGEYLEAKLEVAKSMLHMMQQVGAQLLIVSSCTAPYASADLELIAEQLRLLGDLAAPLGIRIGYEPLSWGRWVNDYPTAWQAVQLADRDNVGLVLGTFHLFAQDTPLEPLAQIPMDKLFLVQLSDAMWDFELALEELVETSRHHRVFPGEGEHSVAVRELVQRLEAAGYHGTYALEVSNDEFMRVPPEQVVARARQAADWLRGQLG